jgi:hypothetical protein
MNSRIMLIWDPYPESPIGKMENISLLQHRWEILSLSPLSRPKMGKVKVDFSGFWMRG